MQIKKSFFLLLMALGLSGCATKEYTKQESIFIVFKTPTVKHADLGFIYANEEEMKIEMYSNGQAIMALEIGKETICMSLLECLDKKSFNAEILSEQYPLDILNHIFRGNPIYNGVNLVKTSNGFTQKIVKAGKYDIDYSILNKQIIFRDTINNILIKLKRLK